MRILLITLISLFGIQATAQTQWTIRNREQPRMMAPDSAFKLPAVNFLYAPYSNKDSVSRMWFYTPTNEIYAQFPGNIKKAVATKDSVLSRWDSTTIKRLLQGKYVGKKFLVIGDSFTAQNLFQDSLIKYLGITIVNDGISGSCITGGTVFAEGDGVARKPMVDRIDAQLALYNDLDGVIIEGGSNDWNYQATLGDIAVAIPDTLTFYGSCKYIFAKCAAYARPLTIIPVTLMQRNGIPHNGPSTTGRANYEGQLKYQKAMIASANLYGLPVADIFHASGMTYENSGIYTVDGTHPSTTAGRYKYSQFLVESILGQTVPGIDNNRTPLTGYYESTGVNRSDSMSNPIYVLGAQFAPATYNLGTMYGIGYTGSNSTFLPTGSGGFGLYVAANGIAKAFISATNGDIILTGKVQAATGAIGLTSAPNSTLQVNGSMSNTVRNTTVTTSLTISDYYLTVANTTNIVVNLPSASSCTGRTYVIVKTTNNGNTVIITPTSGTIAGAATITLSSFEAVQSVWSDGTNWHGK